MKALDVIAGICWFSGWFLLLMVLHAPEVVR
jgi:hypothetical protein